jgi:hypothetical protein
MSYPRVAFNARHISETPVLLTTVHAAMLMRLNTLRIEAIDFSQISRSSGSFFRSNIQCLSTPTSAVHALGTLKPKHRLQVRYR